MAITIETTIRYDRRDGLTGQNGSDMTSTNANTECQTPERGAMLNGLEGGVGRYISVILGGSNGLALSTGRLIVLTSIHLPGTMIHHIGTGTMTGIDNFR